MNRYSRMKKVVSSSILSVVILVMIAGGFFYYQYYHGGSSSALEAVPADVAWLVSCDPSSGALQQLAHTGFFNGHDTIPVLHDWYASLVKFDSLAVNSPDWKKVFADHPLVISGHVTGPGSFSLLYITKLGGANPDGAADKIVQKLLHSTVDPQTRNYNGVDIRELSAPNSTQTFVWAVSKGVFIGSFTSYLVEDAIRQQRSGKTASPALLLEPYIQSKDHGLIAAIRYSGFTRWVGTQLDPAANVKLIPLQRLGDWTVTRLELHPNLISFKGATLHKDSVEFLSLFTNQTPVPIKVMSMMPSKTAATVVWGVSDPQQFLNDLGGYLTRTNTQIGDAGTSRTNLVNYFKGWIGEEISLVVTQPVSGVLDNHYFALIGVSNPALCKSQLQALAKQSGSTSEEETYNGYTIRYLPQQGVLPCLLGPLYVKLNHFYYSVIDNYLVVANQASALRGFINDIKTKNLLVADARYSALSGTIPAKSNLVFYCSIPQSERIFRSVAAPHWVSWLSKYSETLKSWNGMTLSISSQKGIFNTEGALSYFNSKEKGPRLTWNTKLDAPILCGPFFPGTKNNLILVQDQQLQLYAIDQEGNIRWKKKLETAVKSNVFAVDYYKNGAEQFIFSTHSFIYLLDSAGASMGNYPMRLPAEASNGIAMIRYDSISDPRLYIACTNFRLYGYEITGKPLAGFSAVKLQNLVKTDVQVAGTGDNKVLLVNDETNSCFLVDRKGSKIQTIKHKVEFLHGTTFMVGVDSGGIFQWIDPEGVVYNAQRTGEVNEIQKFDMDSITGVVRLDVNGDGDPDWILTGKTGLEAVTTDKVILYRFKTDEGDVASAPVIFESDKKQYISFSTPASGRFYLLNRDGTLCEGFPQTGMGWSLNMNPKSSGSLMIVQRGDSMSINLYEIE